MEQLPDARLVDQAKAGDQQAFAELYSRWFDSVYDFAARITRDYEEAAGIAHDTFLRAMNTLGGLQEGISFRSWVFTIARNAALNRLGRAPRALPLALDGDRATFESVDPGRMSDPAEAAEADALAPFVWDAAAALDPKQLSLLDLHLRQGLDGGEIAAVVGVTHRNGNVLVDRLRKTAEKTIDASITTSDGPGTEFVSPLAVYAAFAAVGSPIGLKAQVLEGLLQQWPGPASAVAGGGPPSRGAPPEPPVPPMPPEESWLFGHLLKVGTGLGAAAVILAVLLLLPASPLALTRSAGPGPFQAGGDSSSTLPGDANPTQPAAPTRNPGPSPSPTRPNTPPASPSPSPQPAGGPTSPTATATSTSNPVAGATATSTPTSTPTAVPSTSTSTPQSCNPQLGTNLSAPLPVALDGDSTFELLNYYSSFSCSATFSVSVQGGSWLTVLPLDGTLGAGKSMTVSVHVNGGAVPSKEGIQTAVIHITGPGNAVDVTVTTSRGGQPPSIQSASGICSHSPAPGASVFSATVTDDVGVASVSLRYTDSGGVPHNWSMNAGSGSAWTVTVYEASPFGASGFTIVALDGANHAANDAFSPSGCN